MNRDDLKGKTYAEVSELFDKELEEYKNKVAEVMDQETLDKMEAEVNDEYTEVNNYLTDVTYDLPGGVDFDGKHYSKNDVAQQIVYFLNKNEVEWSYTLGLFELAKLWKNKDFAKISYYTFDSTLRTLNQIKFKGFDEWKNILVVNEYMKQCHDEYTKDTAMLLFVSQKHNAILDRMQLIQKVEPVNETNE